MLLSTYCNPQLSWTSQWQQLQELYACSCAALQLKPNSSVIRYLYEMARDFKSPNEIVSLDFSRYFLGRRGALPLLGVVRHCASLQSLNLSESGVDDIACHSICASLSEHPNLSTLDLRGTNITGASLEYLHRLGNCWFTRELENGQKKTQRAISILIAEGYGLNRASCASLRNWTSTRHEGHWGFAPSTRPKVSLLEKRSRVIAGKGVTNFASDLRMMEYRLRVSDYLASQVPTGRVQLSSDRWLVLSVFVSCSYKEFHDEANLIHRIIFPRANWKLRAFRIHLVPVMLHSTLEEYFHPAATAYADGGEPIDYTRLPSYRKGRRAFDEDRCGRKHGLLYNEEGARSSEVRSLMIKSCDAFVGIYDDMFDRSISQTDFDVAVSQAIPMMSFKRKISGLPAEFAHLHDFRRSLEFAHASLNSNLTGRSFGARSEVAIREEIDKELNDFGAFMSKVEKKSSPVYVEYEAPYSRAYLGGELRFDIDEDFVKFFIVNLVSLGHHYLSRREGGSSPSGTVFDSSATETTASRSLPSITCQNWGHEPPQSTFTKSLAPLLVAPFKSEEEVLRLKHGIGNSNASHEEPVNTDLACERPFCAIVGASGCGKTTQLRAIAAEISQDSLATVVKHSTIHGKPSLVSTIMGILQQLYRKFAENGSSVFEQFPTPDASEDALIKYFCESLKKAPMLSEFSSRVCFFIDDDDFADCSLVKLFLDNPSYRQLLQDSLPSADCRAQFFFTCNTFDRGDYPEGLLLVKPVPLFSETEAADLFYHYAVGGSSTHPALSAKVKEAARRIAFTKRHGTRPLYIYLAAREVAYYLEATPVGSIVEVLPETVEELAETAMKVALPPDIECFFEALASAPEPFTGAMLRYAMNNYRQYPHFTEKTAEKLRWLTPRTWGRIDVALASSAGTISIGNANFCHLFEHCMRTKGGFLTSRWHSTKHNIWRTPWRFAHRTVLEAARRIFCPSSLPNIPNTELAQQVWERPLKRLAYMRESPFVVKSLSNLPDVTFFSQVPQRLFTLLDNKAYDEIVVLMHEMRAKARSPDEMNVLLDFAEYCRKYWSALKRHRTFFFVRPEKGPAAVADRLLLSQKQHPCARFEEAHRVTVELTESAKLGFKSSRCGSCCAVYATYCGRPHEVTPEVVAHSKSNRFGEIILVDTESHPVTFVPHQTAVCNVEISVRSDTIRILSIALLDPKIVVAVKKGSSVAVIGSVSLDFIPRASFHIAISTFDSTIMSGEFSEDVPSVAYADKNVLCVTASSRATGSSSRQPQRFDGHSSPITLCGFSPAGCKVFSVDGSGSCIVWGAPDGPLCGSILAVTTITPVPRNAWFVDSSSIMYSVQGGLFMWNSETSYVTNMSPELAKGDVADRFAVVFDASHDAPCTLGCVDVASMLIKWLDWTPSAVQGFSLGEHMLIQKHVSTADAVGNREVAGWRWRFSDKYAVAYDPGERTLKAFSRRACRQIPLFFAFAFSDLSQSQIERVPGTREAVFVDIKEFIFIGSENIAALDEFGNAFFLKIIDGPMVYPTGPIVLDV